MKKKLVIFTGAGISAESGIPTFRDSNGMWGKYDAMKLASVEGFEEDPQAVLDFYNARRKNLLEVQPNHAHLVLAELEKQYEELMWENEKERFIDEVEEYTIVGSKEADPAKDKISNESPLAKGLMGHKAGEVCTVESPNGNYQVEIVEIK